MKRERKVRKTIFAKGITQLNVGKTPTKVQVDLYYVKANLYTEYMYQISSQYLKGWLREVENRVDGHQVDGQADWLSDGEKVPRFHR